MENRKELIKKFRAQVAGGKYASRETLLAYAFLREKPYVELERIINEDHVSFGPNGRNTYLKTLAYSIAVKITEIHLGKSYWDLKDDGELRKTFREIKQSVRPIIYNWLQEKYSAKESGVAA